jgi:hypothetical protein
MRSTGRVLLPPAQREELGVELLDAQADPRHARLAHPLELRRGEELGDPLE